MAHWLRQATLIGNDHPQQLLIDQGVVVAIEPEANDLPWFDPSIQVVDLGGDRLSLGGIDVQINGALGLPFPLLQPQHLPKLREIGRFLWNQGVDAYLPTLVTSAIADIHRALETLATAFSSQPSIQEAHILGVHLEGPFLNPQKRGAHPQKHLLPLTIDQVKRVLGDYGPIVKVITLAPELDETGTVIPYLREQGITVSLGHSLATATQASQAFDQGATMVTHAFNAMPSLHHRNPGLLAAAIADERVWYGLIADGQHVDPLMINLLLRCDRPHQAGTFLVSDALAPLGLADGVYPWDEREITIDNGTARLEDGTLAGTTLPLLAAVTNLVQWRICSWDRAIALGTLAPRQAIGESISAIHSGIGVGTRAEHLLRWSTGSKGPQAQRLDLGG
ncbi:N-acetylglucosamine-6-phosphate deacetylase [Candidatus Synechococcus calcipolaris G9]|uniref:N-acetylglucosamine-6-phosphate deacetylase n=1 Tax=Candidatus Synechococcus calcipolaris G9 TaxID=1497997 RepID=A0ABT6EZP6_9SYNE|nr:N-acetylglucosamine-6-phosphate deacetylase [Candidatus Synechococcus calcipolaris]MDG2991050.1 N-acetylglucosamine-6-phosphate deacetylase [Candidatus Synechococcus calcipolaris G9]